MIKSLEKFSNLCYNNLRKKNLVDTILAEMWRHKLHKRGGKSNAKSKNF